MYDSCGTKNTMKKSIKYWYTLGFGGKFFNLFIIGGRIGQDPSRICDEKTPDANPDTWTKRNGWRVSSSVGYFMKMHLFSKF